MRKWFRRARAPLRSFHAFVLVAALAHPLGALAFSPQWLWIVDADSTTFDNKAAAVAHQRSIGYNRLFSQETGPTSMSRNSVSYEYIVPPTTVVIKTDWSYSYGDSARFDSEGAVVADREAAWNSVNVNSHCPAASFVPDGDWGTTSSVAGIPMAQRRFYRVTNRYTYDSILMQCDPTSDTGYGFIYRTRDVGCPLHYDYYSTAPNCRNTGRLRIRGRPLICPNCSAGGDVGNPINVATADKTQREVDYDANGLRFERTYHSQTLEASGNLGVGWIHSYERRIVVSGTSAYGLVRPDGLQEPLTGLGTGRWVTTTGSGVQLKLVGSEWIVCLSNGDTEVYGSTGRLLRLVTASGQVTSVSYVDGKVATVTGPFGHSLQFVYDDGELGGNRLLQVLDPSGGIIAFSYDPYVNLQNVTYPDSTSRTYHYEDAAFPNNLTGITDEAGVRYATFAYDSSGRAISTEHIGGVERLTLDYQTNSTTVTDPAGTVSTYNFTTDAANARNITSRTVGARTRGYTIPSVDTDPQRRASQETDERGFITKYVYDNNHLTSKTEAFGTPRTRTTSYTYVANLPTDDLPTQVTEPGRVTTYTYGSLRLVLTKTVTDTATAQARTWTYTYDSYGRVLTEDGPRTDVSDVTTYTYYTCSTGYECGRVNTVTNALGQVTTFNTYNAHGQPLTITDANGVVSTLTYDSRYRLTSRQVGSETTTFEYWPTGLLKKATLPDGSYTQYTYDQAHRLTSIADGAGNHIDYTLDLMGNRTAENVYDDSSSLSRTRTQVFNAFNELWKQVGAAGTTAVTSVFAYDNSGNQTSTDAPLARTTSSQYDELNRLKQVTDAASGITQFAYDVRDNLTSVTDPRNKVTSYTYNAFGDLTVQVSPDTGTTSNTYDSGGNLATTTDARSKVGTYTYDALNRVTQLSYPDRTIAFTYDVGTNGVGRLTAASDANHSLGWTYDAQGRVTGKTQTVGAVAQSVSYGYTNGNVTSLTTPSGQVIGYGYTDGRITSVTLNGSTTILSQVLYEPFGPIRQWTWGNSTLTNRTYDLDGNPVAIDSAGATSYALDDAFRITGIDDLADSSLSWAYGYDLLDRLTSASKASQSIGYTYDANGNRLTQTGTTAATYTLSSTNNRIVSISGTPSRTYSYDNSGNTTGYAGTTFAYDDSGRMTSVTAGGVTTSYTLNALGQRVKKSSASTTRLFAYDEAGHLLGEYDGSGALIQETVWLGDIPVATLRPDGSGVSLYYVHTDHLNTPRRLTRPTDNAVVWRWDSDPFGTNSANEDPDGDGVPIAYNLRFAGQYFDGEAGLVYNYFRDGYDPYIGRYTQSDPIGLAGGVNTYAYANGDPISRSDPTGQFAPPPAMAPPVAAAVIGWYGGYAIGTIIYNGIAVSLQDALQVPYDPNAPTKPNCPPSCPECSPYKKGTVGYIGPHADDHYSKIHGRNLNPHLNLFVVQQNPQNCKCYWRKNKPDAAEPPPSPGWVNLNSGFPALTP